MSEFRRVAQITLSNIGGNLDSILAESTDSFHIGQALRQLVGQGVFEVGDTIKVYKIEVIKEGRVFADYFNKGSIAKEWVAMINSRSRHTGVRAKFKGMKLV